LNLQDDNLPRKLIIDIDDTCVDTLTAFVKWLASLGRLKNVEGNKITSREHLGTWLNIPDELADLWMKEFCETSWQWGALYPMLGAEQVLPRLVQQGWVLVGYSKSSNEMNRAILRRANVELLFPGVFKELYVVPKTQDLYPLVTQHEYAVCVTSTELVARSCAQARHPTYMIKQPWNHDFSDLSVRKFNNWIEIEQALASIII
jgi:hypothetical protein